MFGFISAVVATMAMGGEQCATTIEIEEASVLWATAVTATETVIGAMWEDNENGNQAGAAYIAAWTTEGLGVFQRLLPVDGSSGDDFGFDVALTDEILLVSAPGAGPGALYLLRPGDSGWEFRSRVDPPGGAFTVYQFGTRIAVSGNRVAVAAPSSRVDDQGQAGAVFVYTIDGDDLGSPEVLVPPVPEFGQRFGLAIALDGDRLAIAAPGDSELAFRSGAVFMYEHDGSEWQLVQKILPPVVESGYSLGGATANPENSVNQTLVLSGDLLIAAAPRADESEQLTNSGRVHLYRHNGGAWEDAATIVPDDAVQSLSFGSSVALDGSTLLIGSSHDANGEQNGAVHVYQLDDWTATLEQVLFGSDTDGQVARYLGWHTAVYGRFVIAPYSQLDTPIVHFFDLDLEPECDCNGNGQLDRSDLLLGISVDSNENGVPDECDCPADLDGNGDVGFTDLMVLLGAWGDGFTHPADLDGDFDVDFLDLMILLGQWGACTGA